jgi:hypothetical protein
MVGPRSLTILTAALLIMAFYLSLAPGYPNSPSDLDARDRFVRGDLPATAYLNDLGVADVNVMAGSMYSRPITTSVH